MKSAIEWILGIIVLVVLAVIVLSHVLFCVCLWLAA